MMRINKEKIYAWASFFLRGIGAFLCIVLGGGYIKAGQHLEFFIVALLGTVIMLPGEAIKKSLKLSKLYWIIIFLILLVVLSEPLVH